MTPGSLADLGVVVIGRNEGERLRRCLESVRETAALVTYVDSGSEDGSRELARALDVVVIDLDLTTPFTAARARNEGWRRLREVAPDVRFVQFVDGDCELDSAWLNIGRDHLAANPDSGVTFGRLFERYPEASIWNRICDMERSLVPGLATECGGLAMMRLDALEEVGGYDPGLIAGEEPELCVRLRSAGYAVVALDADMGLHDAAMTRVGQWWRRNVRGGHAYAEGAWMHGRVPERFKVREVASVVFWALLLPVCCLAAAWPTGGWSLAGLAGYPVIGLRSYIRTRSAGHRASDAGAYAVSCVLGKWPQLIGILTFVGNRLTGTDSSLIEYK